MKKATMTDSAKSSSAASDGKSSPRRPEDPPAPNAPKSARFIRKRPPSARPDSSGQMPPAKRSQAGPEKEALPAKAGKRKKKVRIEGYQIIEKVGAGAMGAVYRAKQVAMDRIVALKVLPPKLARDEKFIKSFYAEARASAKLNHVNLVAGIDVGCSGGLYYFAMEFVDGESAKALLKREGPLPAARALEIGIQVASALEHAHRHKLVHRDVKPDNILIQKDGTARLADLGLVKSTFDENSSGDALAAGKKAVGTAAYMAPEQARGDEDIDIRTDLYALGATLYHLLRNKYLFRGKWTEVLRRQVKSKATNLLKRLPDLDPGLAFVVEKCLCKKREDRYADPAALREDLERVRDGRVPRAALEEALGASSMGSTAAALKELRKRYPPPEQARKKTQPRIVPGASAASSSAIRPGHRKSIRSGPADSSDSGMLLWAGLAAALFAGLAFVLSNGSGSVTPRHSAAARGRHESGGTKSPLYQRAAAEHAKLQALRKAMQGKSTPAELLPYKKKLAALRNQARTLGVKEQAAAQLKRLEARVRAWEARDLGRLVSLVNKCVKEGRFAAALEELTPGADQALSDEGRAALAEEQRRVEALAEEHWETLTRRSAALEAEGKYDAAQIVLETMAGHYPETLEERRKDGLASLRKRRDAQRSQQVEKEFQERLKAALALRQGGRPSGWLKSEDALKALAAEKRFRPFAAQCKEPLAQSAPRAKFAHAARAGMQGLKAGEKVYWYLDGAKRLTGRIEASGAKQVKVKWSGRERTVTLDDLAPDDLLERALASGGTETERLAWHLSAAQILMQAGHAQRARAVLEAAAKLPGGAASSRLQSLRQKLTARMEQERAGILKRELKATEDDLSALRVGEAMKRWTALNRRFPKAPALAAARDALMKRFAEARRKVALQSRLKGALGKIEHWRQVAQAAAQPQSASLQRRKDYWELANLFAALGNYKNAEKALRLVPQAGPNVHYAVQDGTFNLLRSHLKRVQGDAKGAEAELQAALGQPNVDRWTRKDIRKARGWIASFAEAKKQTAALRAKQRAQAGGLPPDEWWAYVQLLDGPLHRQLDALAQLRVLLDLYPKHPAFQDGEALWRQTELLARFGLWFDTILSVRRVRKEFPEHWAVKEGEAYWMEATALMEKGDYRGALALLQSMLIRYPKHWAVQDGEVDSRIKICSKKR